MDDDDKFDKFLQELEYKRANKNPTPKATGTPGFNPISQEDFLKKFNLIEE